MQLSAMSLHTAFVHFRPILLAVVQIINDSGFRSNKQEVVLDVKVIAVYKIGPGHALRDLRLDLRHLDLLLVPRWAIDFQNLSKRLRLRLCRSSLNLSEQ